MRTSLVFLILALSVISVSADVFKNKKVKVGKKTCTCSFTLYADGTKMTSASSGKCDKKCSGVAKSVKMEGESGEFSFSMKVTKGKVVLSKGEFVPTVTAPPTGSGSGSMPPTGSGSGSIPPTGSGSGSMPPTGSGSGSTPPTGSGSGSEPTTPTEEGMQCSCKCDCPDGSGDCDCSCNCPEQPTSLTCAVGFSKVCPMSEGTCPEDMEMVCPEEMKTSRSVQNRIENNEERCQCVPDFLLSLVMADKIKPTARSAVPDVIKNKKVKVGKKSCKCSFTLIVDGEKISSKSKASCDKKCTGTAKGLELEGDSGNVYTFDLKSVKGKTTISKGSVELAEGPSGEGSGSGTGSAPPLGSGPICACVAAGMTGTGSGSGSNPAPGSGSGTIPGSGSESGSETGSGSGSGSGTIPGSGSESGSETGSGSGSGTMPGSGSESGSETGSGNETGSGSGETGSGSGTQAKYVPGTPGGAWTPEEITITRRRILELVDPRLEPKMTMFGRDEMKEHDLGPVSENTLMRLTFHDCLKYTDGTGGCDGCLNWKGMGFRYKNFQNSHVPEEERVPQYYYEPANMTDNNGLDRIVAYLEKIYTTTDWPSTLFDPEAEILTTSLMDNGKSRGDFWAFAGLVALEQSIDRANFACDHDFNRRQQVTLLEGRDKCDIKLTKPIKFQTGRVDCVPTNEEFPYMAEKSESDSIMFGSAEEILAWIKGDFGMTARQFIALNGIHSVVSIIQHNILGGKYEWVGNQYLSNMYYKMIVNRPIYEYDMKEFPTQGNITIADADLVSVGNVDGEPIASRNWRVNCFDLWNTTVGGPCFLRHTSAQSPESPTSSSDPKAWSCGAGIDADGNTLVKDKAFCEGATFDKNGVQTGGRPMAVSTSEYGWSNMFGMNYEMGMYYKFNITGPEQRPTGCPGLNVDKIEDFPYGNSLEGGFMVATDVMQCGLNEHAPEGEPIYKIMEDYADDHDVWAAEFLEGWMVMINNGYTNLTDGPQNGWLGYAALENRVDIEDYEAYIAENSPLVFTDPNVEPWFCGHHGGSSHFCGYKMKEIAPGMRTYKP